MDKYGHPYGTPPNQYGYDSPPKRSTGLVWVLILVGGGGALFFVVCCGICGWAAYTDFEEDDAYLQELFQENEVVQEKIGNINHFERDWARIIDEDDEDIWYFRVAGDKGSGDIVIHDSGLRMHWARLELESGETFDIYP